MNKTQKKVVSEMGFNNLLQLNIKRIPGDLALHVVNMLDTDAMVIRTTNGAIPVNRMAVHEVFGFPMGEIPIEDNRRSNNNDDIFMKWKKETKSVTPTQVQKEIKATRSADLMFRIKFLVLMVSTLIKAMPNGNVNQKFLKSIEEDRAISSFDWCGYVVDSVRHCKDDWNPNSLARATFIGPITFLVLLYCDRVLVGPAIERKRPVIAGWELGDLEKRQRKEFETGGFGLGELLLEWRETPAGKEWAAKHSHTNFHFDGCGCTKRDGDDGGEEKTEEEVVEGVFKAFEDADKQLYDAIGRFGDNERLQSFKKKWDSVSGELLPV